MNQRPDITGGTGTLETCYLHDHDDRKLRILGNVDHVTQQIQAGGQDRTIKVTLLNGKTRELRAGNLASVSPARRISTITGHDIHDWNGQA